jgi:protein arginine kinase activator
MKCQSCGQRNAKVHLTEIDENKQKRELHLCEQCHGQQNPGSPETGMDVLGLLSTAFATPSGEAPPTNLECEACGLGYSEFRSRGRLGCPECYEVFQESLDPLLEKVHAHKRHVGKQPGDESRANRSQERKLVELRRRLQEAVENEAYEDAARLRDELRQCEEDDDEPDSEPPAFFDDPVGTADAATPVAEGDDADHE